MESSIQVGVSGPAVWVRVEGKGNFLNSGNFKQFAREMVDRGYREFVVDLVDCVMMDSTFMGTMAGLALRLKELGQGHLRVVHCGERSRQLLSRLQGWWHRHYERLLVAIWKPARRNRSTVAFSRLPFGIPSFSFMAQAP